MSSPRGDTNPVTVLFVLGGIAGAWWLWVFGPAYSDQFDVKDEVWQTFSTALKGEEMARDALIHRLNTSIGWHYEIDEESGAEVIRPGLGVAAEAVEVKADAENEIVRVRVEYDRVLPLKPTSRRTVVHFVAEKSGKVK